MSLRMEIYSSDEPDSPAMEPTPSSQPVKSQPPPLPESARRLSPARAAADATFADSMIERLAAGDYAGVVMAAEALLEHQPNHADALDSAQIARSELAKVYQSRLGSMERVPRVVMGPEGLLALSLDFGAGLLLSRVNGTVTLAGIVETCGLPKLESLRILSELFLRRAIGFDD
ncbi:MAG: hypothetical protein ACLP1X_14015 [Polyangiaceae bacterium]|jgi:hypothetical protein